MNGSIAATAIPHVRKWRVLLRWHLAGSAMGGSVMATRATWDAIRLSEFPGGGPLVVFALSTLYFATLLLLLAPLSFATFQLWLRAAQRFRPELETSFPIRFIGLTVVALFVAGLLAATASLPSGGRVSEMMRFYYTGYVLAAIAWIVGPRLIVRSLRGSLLK